MLFRQPSQRLQPLSGHDSSRRIIGIADQDRLGLGRDQGSKRLGIHLEPFFLLGP